MLFLFAYRLNALIEEIAIYYVSQNYYVSVLRIVSTYSNDGWDSFRIPYIFERFFNFFLICTDKENIG